MRQFLSLLVIVAVVGCVSALSDERKEVEHMLGETVKEDGENPHDFAKEAQLLNEHLTDEQVHQLVQAYAAMTPEQQAAFKAKLVEGGKAFEHQKSHGVAESSVLSFIKKAAMDSKK